ncbi:MAG: hypothetical protein NZM37_05980 [Sandaracinaceae bacterium]|nr:hypothetical protein [Sandaracinaceae bacterium]
MQTHRLKNPLFFSVFAFLCNACLERELGPVTPCTRSAVGQTIQITPVDTVDLLLMVDNSGSMREEQMKLTREIPRIVRILASGDLDEDGREDFTPVRSMHVGIISSDMGSGPVTGIGTCRPGLGDDGRLLNRCPTGDGTTIFRFDRGMDPNAFAETIRCASTLGITGCGFEQQLEAVLKALSPSSPQSWTRPNYQPPRFVAPDGITQNQVGHGDGANRGFIRENSVLAILMLTDEEDCSLMNYRLMEIHRGPRINVACDSNGDARPERGFVFPVERYVEGYLGLRRSPNLLVFSAITGIPLNAEDSAERGEYSAILDRPDMQHVVDETRMPIDFRPACESPDGFAIPARRILQVAAGLAQAGVAVSVSSICAPSFERAVSRIIEKIASALGGACLPRPLNPAPDGRVNCEVLEILPRPGSGLNPPSCRSLAGRTFLRVEEGREVCRVQQVTREQGMNNSAPGWFYDNFTAEVRNRCGLNSQRIAFTTVAPPTPGANVRLECLQSLRPGVTGGDELLRQCDGGSGCKVGQFCGNPGGDCGTSSHNDKPLKCDAVDRICAVKCENDADCESAGLIGFICDGRTNGEAAGAGGMQIDMMLRSAPRKVCVNPTCN